MAAKRSKPPTPKRYALRLLDVPSADALTHHQLADALTLGAGLAEMVPGPISDDWNLRQLVGYELSTLLAAAGDALRGVPVQLVADTEEDDPSAAMLLIGWRRTEGADSPAALAARINVATRACRTVGGADAHHAGGK